MKKFLLASILLLSVSISHASHLFGGEITWVCTGNGQYVFTLKVYRDCNGIPFVPVAGINVYGHPTVCTIPLNPAFTVITDISPQQCPNNCNTGGAGTIQEIIQVSDPITLAGVPPASGWVFDINSCCRNQLVNANGGGQSFSLRSIMYPYNGTNENPCFDSSPYFAERPHIFSCVGFPIYYNPSGIDPDNDSLVYAWANIVDAPTNPPCASYNAPVISFSSPYTTTAQLPGSPTLNFKTGEISFFPPASGTAIGNFATCIKVTAYKCGVKVAEVFRDCSFTLISGCTVQGVPPNNINLPPVVVSSWGVNLADTVVIGDTVDFIISISDIQINTNGSPQSVIINSASGIDFGTGFTSDSTGCPFPPCATLIPPPSPNGVQLATSKHFHWVPGCETLASCYSNFDNTHRFVIKVQDNYCPAPATTFATIKITVIGPAINQSNDSMWISHAGATTFQWYLNNTPIAGATDSLYVTNVPGYYTCIIGNAAGCTYASQPLVSTVGVGIADAVGLHTFEIVPNPASTVFTVTNNFAAGSIYTISITDVLGHALITQTHKGAERVGVDVAALASGVYFVVVEGDGVREVKKLVKE
jgi:hypothetical protein